MYIVVNSLIFYVFTVLPVVSVVEVFFARLQVLVSQQQQVNGRTKVGECQIAHQKPRHRVVRSFSECHQQYDQVGQKRRDAHQPDTDPQPVKAHYIFTWVERVRLGPTFNVRSPVFRTNTVRI